MQNISGFGLIVNVRASRTFPLGIPLTQFADDADPLDIPGLQIADSAMGLNGDLIGWSKANPIKVTLNILPNTTDDIEMSILFEANRVGRGKIGARDIITMTLLYPSGNFVTLTPGMITDGSPSSAVASAGRLKTKSYSFTFEGRIGA